MLITKVTHNLLVVVSLSLCIPMVNKITFIHDICFHFTSHALPAKNATLTLSIDSICYEFFVIFRISFRILSIFHTAIAISDTTLHNKPTNRCQQPTRQIYGETETVSRHTQLDKSNKRKWNEYEVSEVNDRVQPKVLEVR